MENTETIRVSLPMEICGCFVDRVLTEDHTFLAVGPGGRNVVLKAIDPDCLLRGTLHPSVRDRLSRVRELAHGSIANLFGVEREGDVAYLIWEYVEGFPFDISAANRTPRELAVAARELVMAVDLLHMQGIVHGALIGSNVIVSPAGGVRLTHISPLLYCDPGVDLECIWNLLANAAEQLGDRGMALALVVTEGREGKITLRQLATRLGALIDTRDAQKGAEPEVLPTSNPRRRALFGAALVALMGVAAAWGVWHAIEGGHFVIADTHHIPFHNQADH
jgi:hypothetical protein